MSMLDDVVSEAIEELRDRVIVNGPVDYPEDEMSDIANEAISEISTLDALRSRPEFMWEKTDDGDRCDTVEELVNIHIYYHVLNALEAEWYGGMESEYEALYCEDKDEDEDDSECGCLEESETTDSTTPAVLKYWSDE